MNERVQVRKEEIQVSLFVEGMMLCDIKRLHQTTLGVINTLRKTGEHKINIKRLDTECKLKLSAGTMDRKLP